MTRASLSVLVLALMSEAAAAQSVPAPGFSPLDIESTPIAQFFIGSGDARVGELTFLGGLELSSDDDDFGATSGVDITPDGSVVLASDIGRWITFNLIEAGGRPTGVANAQMAPMLDAQGAPLGDKANADAESVRLVEHGGRLTALVPFELLDQVRAYDVSRGFDSARGETVPLPATVRGLGVNRGIESVAVAPADGPLGGATVLVAERSLDKAKNHRAWILSGPRQGIFSIRRTDNFDVTDADFLPNGDLIILERRFGLGSGIAMRLRRFAAAELAPGKTVDGQQVAFADLRAQIDNMEGLAVSTGPGGETIITLVSDDNLNMLQRTLLLRFAWQEVVPPIPVPRPATAGSGASLPDTAPAAAAPSRS